jgi:hypothetical protein
MTMPMPTKFLSGTADVLLGARPVADDCVSASWNRTRSASPPMRATAQRSAPRAVLRHCGEEFANLVAILPDLYRRVGPAAGSIIAGE